jgi:hypothetical protein
MSAVHWNKPTGVAHFSHPTWGRTECGIDFYKWSHPWLRWVTRWVLVTCKNCLRSKPSVQGGGER